MTLPAWKRPKALFAGMGLLLLTLAWWWHLPMMVWDHLDLVPLLQAKEDGALQAGRLLEHHGGHIHEAAYLVLLQTTTLSGGWPMADVLVSWALHFIPQTRDIHTDAEMLREQIMETWRDVPEPVLRELYFDRPFEARERLQYLHGHAYPPFDQPSG